MLTLIGRLAKLFKKDFQFLANYERSHPHFFWYLGIDALLAAGIVFGGFTLYIQATSDEHRLSHVGAQVVTSQELREHVKEEDVLAYWLGSIPGYEYTMNHSEAGVADVFYWQKGSYDVGSKQFLYEVKTYKNQKVWDARTHTILATANTEAISINDVVVIRINRGSMKGVIATFRDKSEIVALAYPAPQTLVNMIKNVQSLEPIQ